VSEAKQPTKGVKGGTLKTENRHHESLIDIYAVSPVPPGSLRPAPLAVPRAITDILLFLLTILPGIALRNTWEPSAA
jgi:hypothetical protein